MDEGQALRFFGQAELSSLSIAFYFGRLLSEFYDEMNIASQMPREGSELISLNRIVFCSLFPWCFSVIEHEQLPRSP
jgi:hypothetical protein